MTVSVFDLFSVGIGPSSSHTVGPMRAAARFVAAVESGSNLDQVAGIEVDLFGSLAATGAGHGTMPAILLGLEGRSAEHITGDEVRTRLSEIHESGAVELPGGPIVPLREQDIRLHPEKVLPAHPNGMTFTARDAEANVLAEQTYFSVGGGFVVTAEEVAARSETGPARGPFSTAAELMECCRDYRTPVSDVMLRFESTTRPTAEVRDYLVHVSDVMWECFQRGIESEGELPGGLNVRRRAPGWHRCLSAEDQNRDPVLAEDWINLVALAVNEENAGGGRVVTAPTNGAAGVIPAVLYYAIHYTEQGRTAPRDVTVKFLLTAGAIGSLYKECASISGADVGCQGEVGSAASMAAGALAEILGGTPDQVENAAEIAMEHSLGMTCDPVGGLVQIPCIERNAISAGKAINAARMALRGDGQHRVSLDMVITTMRETGRDMNTKYKETSMGGLALTVLPVNIVEC
jgi:L-serine dehydratase